MGRKRIARYELIEKEEETLILQNQKVSETYSLSRRINKASNAKLLEMLFNNEVAAKDIIYYIYLGERRKQAWNSLISYDSVKDERLTLCHKILKRSNDFINEVSNINLIATLAEWKEAWIRDPEDWRPTSRNLHVQAESLLEHCLINFPVPKFLYNSIYRNNLDGTFLLFHLTAGNSYKTYIAKPPLVVSNKIYQYLFDVPSDLTYYQGFRWAQIHSLGGDHYVFNAIMQSKLRDSETGKNDEFWVTVIKFFIEHTMIDREKIAEVVDYIYEMKYQRQLVMRNNVRQYGAPLHPGFSMKGRTPDSLIGASDEWHNQVAKYSRSAGASEWRPTLIADYEYKNSDDKITHIIMQLCNTTSLQEEGRNMGNCVATYARSAAEGRCSIFSLRTKDGTSLVTIEVRNKEIAQVRAKYNKKPTESHLYHINKWASQENLLFSRWAI